MGSGHECKSTKAGIHLLHYKQPSVSDKDNRDETIIDKVQSHMCHRPNTETVRHPGQFSCWYRGYLLQGLGLHVPPDTSAFYWKEKMTEHVYLHSPDRFLRKCMSAPAELRRSAVTPYIHKTPAIKFSLMLIYTS